MQEGDSRRFHSPTTTKTSQKSERPETVPPAARDSDSDAPVLGTAEIQTRTAPQRDRMYRAQERASGPRIGRDAGRRIPATSRRTEKSYCLHRAPDTPRIRTTWRQDSRRTVSRVTGYPIPPGGRGPTPTRRGRFKGGTLAGAATPATGRMFTRGLRVSATPATSRAMQAPRTRITFRRASRRSAPIATEPRTPPGTRDASTTPGGHSPDLTPPSHAPRATGTVSTPARRRSAIPAIRLDTSKRRTRTTSPRAFPRRARPVTRWQTRTGTWASIPTRSGRSSGRTWEEPAIRATGTTCIRGCRVIATRATRRPIRVRETPTTSQRDSRRTARFATGSAIPPGARGVSITRGFPSRRESTPAIPAPRATPTIRTTGSSPV